MKREPQYGRTGAKPQAIATRAHRASRDATDEICHLQRDVRRPVVCRHIFHNPQTRLHGRRNRAVHVRAARRAVRAAAGSGRENRRSADDGRGRRARSHRPPLAAGEDRGLLPHQPRPDRAPPHGRVLAGARRSCAPTWAARSWCSARRSSGTCCPACRTTMPRRTPPKCCTRRCRPASSSA